MTWREVEAALAAGRRTVIVGVGSTEQHGPHLPLAMDSLHADALAERVAEQLDQALVAPPVTAGCSDHHMAFPGTISLRAETLAAILTDYCGSLAKHGFERIGLISGHGGNFAPMANMLADLHAAAGAAQVAAYTDLRRFAEIAFNEAVAAGFAPEAIGGHADVAETSVLLALRPDLVKMDQAEPGYRARFEDTIGVVFERGLKAMSPIGVLGDPVGATAALGQRILVRLSEEIAASFKAAWA